MKFDVNDTVLTIALEGRIDTSNNFEISQQIDRIRREYPENDLVLDLEKLVYISSAGLRIILELKKKAPNLKIINAINEVYEIFDITALNTFIPVERALREVEYDSSKLIGNGTTGKTYRLNKETIIKVFEPYMPDDLIFRERELAQKALINGVDTAIPFDVVKTDNGLGIIYEALDTTSLESEIKDFPEFLEEYAYDLGKFMKKTHEITNPGVTIIDQKDVILSFLDKYDYFFSKNDLEKLKSIVSAIPHSDQFSHGDFSPSNVLVQRKSMMLIDLLTSGKGHPIFDWLGFYNSTEFDNTLREITGNKSKESLREDENKLLFETTLQSYYEEEDLEKIEKIKNLIKLLGPLRQIFLLCESVGLDNDNPVIKNLLDIVHENLEKIDSETIDLSFLE